MFLLIGRRYPWVSLLGGAVFLAIGIATGSVSAGLIGCLGLAVGGYRSFIAVRQRGLAGLVGPGSGAGGRGGFGGIHGVPR
jgi:hypothetical protein